MASNSKNYQKKGSMSVSEAGHRGGQATSETHDREFYENIGHEGGQKRQSTNEDKRKRGSMSVSEAGYKGGKATGRRQS